MGLADDEVEGKRRLSLSANEVSHAEEDDVVRLQRVRARVALGEASNHAYSLIAQVELSGRIKDLMFATSHRS